MMLNKYVISEKLKVFQLIRESYRYSLLLYGRKSHSHVNINVNVNEHIKMETRETEK